MTRLPRRLFHLYKNRRFHLRGTCPVCRRYSAFICKDPQSLRGDLFCFFCRSSSRNRHIAKILAQSILPGAKSIKEAVKDSGVRIYNTNACGSIHRALADSGYYLCSEYLPEIPFGTMDERGIWSEDLQNLSFGSDNFDYIITEDVLEHVRDYRKAFTEIKRVLKSGGKHVFTLPLNICKNTARRVDISRGNDIHVLPPVYHEDPLNDEGALVYTDFGRDMLDELEGMKMPTQIRFSEYEDKFSGIFNSMVLISTKQ